MLMYGRSHHSIVIVLKLKINKGEKKLAKGLPWWSTGWESASQCEGHRPDPETEKITQASG